MKYSFTAVALAALSLPSMISAHMVMKTPKPFGNPNNSPLEASGADFPCKGGPYDRSSVSNVMAVGSSQTLSFTGSAVHGGGSCQVSLTTDLNPSKSTKWMVIKSIEGGCPASVEGNLPTDPNGNGASTFQYTIPDGIAPGEYVIAWTWINKIGNREFYMNCGPATITGAQKKRYAPPGVSLARRQNSFPDMFVANIPSVNDCTTPETFDYNYPNPGPEVQSAGTGPYTNLVCGAAGGNNPAPQPTGSPAGGQGSGSGSPSSSPATPTGGSTGGNPNGGNGGNFGPSGAGNNGPAVPSNTATPSTGGSGTNTGPGNGGNGNGSPNGGFNGGNGNGGRPGAPGSFATGAAPLPSDVGPVSPPAGGAAPAAPQPSSDSPATPPASGSAGGNAAGTPCSQEGEWACLPGGASFQRCASGRWSAVMGMANGMSCTPGLSANMAMGASGRVRRALEVLFG